MRELSSHTHQINLWIALTGPDDTFSNTLARLGYDCDVIEEQFYLLDDTGEDVIHPDVVLTSELLDHSLVIDCKSERIKADQVRRYLRVNGNEDQLVIQGLVDGIDADDLEADVVLSSFKELQNSNLPQDLAIVHFEQNPHSGLVIWNPGGYKFDNSDVAAEFPINMHPDQPLPTGHYPFDIFEADKRAMVSTIFSTIISLAIQEGEFSLEDVLARSHPYWDKLGDDKQTALLDRTDIIYHELLDAGLDQYLEKIAGRKAVNGGAFLARYKRYRDEQTTTWRRCLKNCPRPDWTIRSGRRRQIPMMRRTQTKSSCPL